MRKLWSFAILLVITMLLLVACSKKEVEEPAEEKPVESPVVIEKKEEETKQEEKIEEKVEEDTNRRELTDQQIDTVVTNMIEFISKEYGFKVTFPLTWENKYIVVGNDWEKDTLKTYDFIYIDDGVEYGTLFSIVVTDMSEMKFNEHYSGSFVKLIDSNDKFTIGYNIPKEPPMDLINNEDLKHLFMEFSRMVNWDIPIIIDSFEWIKKDNVL